MSTVLRACSLAAVLFLLFSGLRAAAQAPAPASLPASDVVPAPVMLYPQGAPGALGQGERDKPRIYPFLPANRSTRASVLILPGGGYQHVALGHEGIQYAEWLNAQGVAAFVLDYRVAPYRFPIEIEDGRAAMLYIRSHATEFNLDPDRIGVWGSSAGGHLAATLATQCSIGTSGSTGPTDVLSNVPCQPNFVILSYPVIGMEQPVTHPGSRENLLGPNPDPALAHQLSAQFAVTASTAPTFLFATTGDPVVPVANSVSFYSALVAAGVPAEMHLFDYADHGCGLCGTIPELAGWPMLLRAWLVHRNLLPATAPPPPAPSPNMLDWPSGLDGPGARARGFASEFSPRRLAVSRHLPGDPLQPGVSQCCP
jgi:acetyl esterase/lipase